MKQVCYIDTSPLRCWRCDAAGVAAELGAVSLATDTDTVAVEAAAEDFFSFVINVFEEAEFEVCPCNFIHVSPRALAK